MKILILGAGQVGTSVAAALAGERNDITVVDTDHQRLRDLAEKLDIRTVVGHASLPSVLAQAGAEEAGLLVAVTSSDEVNLIACQVAEQRFKTATRVARLREHEYVGVASSVTAAISPEQLVCKHIERLVEYPGALQVLDFADGRAQLVGVRAVPDGALVGHEIRELRQHLPANVDSRVVAIFRNGRPIKPQGSTVIQADDEVFFLADARNIRTVMSELRRLDSRPTRRLLIAGGGNIGRKLARSLEGRYSVKVLERSRERARAIAEELLNSIVLVGDCADEDLLREENIDQTDFYMALTNDDEANILSAMLAKRLVPARAGADQPAELRRAGRGQQHRHRGQPATGHAQRLAGAYPRGRAGAGVFAAPRRRRGDRGDRARRSPDVAGDRSFARRTRPARGDHHRRHRPR